MNTAVMLLGLVATSLGLAMTDYKNTWWQPALVLSAGLALVAMGKLL